MINIKQVLTNHDIYWTDKGHNVSKGNINIRCPLCGPEDKSQHMGIRLSDGYWGCWRSKQHTGKNIHRLLALLNIYLTEEHSDVMQMLINRTFFGSQEIKLKDDIVKPKVTKLPTEFIAIEEESFFTKPYLQYLRKRGFKNPLEICKKYDLRFSIGAGKWSYRLIIPTWVGEEVTWTGRALGDNPLRYLSPAEGEARNIKECLFNYNDLLKSTGEVLVIVEGPLDAITVEAYNERVRVTALFGLSIPDIQIQLLKNICRNYETILIGLDQGTLTQSLQLKKELSDFNPLIMRLPAKDFNEMSAEENRDIIKLYTDRRYPTNETTIYE